MLLIGTYVYPFEVWPSVLFLVHVFISVWLPNFLMESLPRRTPSFTHSFTQWVSPAHNFRMWDMNMKGAPSHNNGKTRMLPAVNGPKTTESRAATSQFGAPPPSKQTSDGGISDGSRKCVIVEVVPHCVRFTADWLQTYWDICRRKKRCKNESHFDSEQLLHNFLCLD